MLPEAESNLKLRDADGSNLEEQTELQGVNYRLLLIAALVDLVLLVGMLLYHLIDPHGFSHSLGLQMNGRCRYHVWWHFWGC